MGAHARRIGTWCLGLVLSLAGAATAQIPLEPRPLRANLLEVDLGGACDRTKTTAPEVRASLAKDPIGQLSEFYHRGDWMAVQNVAKFFLDSAWCSAQSKKGVPEEPQAYDYRNNFIWLTWIGQDSFDAYSLHRVLVHTPSPPAYRLNLPGVSKTFEVFATSTPTGDLTTAVTSTALPNPVTAQIPAFAQKVIPVLLGLTSAALGPGTARGVRDAEPQLFVEPFWIQLPDTRATLALHSVAVERVSDQDFDDSLESMAIAKRLRLTKCVRELLLEDVASIKTVHRSGPCRPGQAKTGCLDAYDATLARALAAKRASAECSSDGNALNQLDGELRTFILDKTNRTATGDATVTNAPLQRISFGLVEAVALGLKLYQPRVTSANDGTIKADPMTRLMTIATVNFSFSAYDGATISPSRSERCRWFVGAVVTPDFGLAGGLSFLAVRGLSINTGVAGLFTKSAPGGAIGKPPAVPTDPFRIGKAAAFFLGIGYAFK